MMNISIQRNDALKSRAYTKPILQTSTLLAALRMKPMTTTEIMDELGILSPSRRICDLIEQGYVIHKSWVTDPLNPNRTRPVRRYVLMPKKRHQLDFNFLMTDRQSEFKPD